MPNPSLPPPPFQTLKNNWSPALSLLKVMLSLSSLLTDPNEKDPLEPTVAKLFKSNRPEHDKLAREWTVKWVWCLGCGGFGYQS
jgi:ubiquitin-protein ligase